MKTRVIQDEPDAGDADTAPSVGTHGESVRRRPDGRVGAPRHWKTAAIGGWLAFVCSRVIVGSRRRQKQDQPGRPVLRRAGHAEPALADETDSSRRRADPVIQTRTLDASSDPAFRSAIADAVDRVSVATPGVRTSPRRERRRPA